MGETTLHNLINSTLLKRAGLEHYKLFDTWAALSFIDSIYIYGSRARGDFLPHSDIDIAINCPTASAEDWLMLESMAENAPILHKMHLQRYDSLEEGLFKDQIDKYKKVLYAKAR
ncbi:MAG: nucleotidyltransferase domain-containing protein [Alphaproteobacteria bacterium]|nr:nucleotidyltransferase domain-containing protein [Alphaproteobacteria bacterium]